MENNNLELRWVVIERPLKNDGDEFVSVYKNETEARQEAQYKWNSLSNQEKRKVEIIAGSANVDSDGNYNLLENSNCQCDSNIREIVFDSNLKTLKEIISDIEELEIDDGFIDNIKIAFGDYEYKGITEVIVSKDESNPKIDYQAYINHIDAPIICIEIRDDQVFNVWEA